MTLKRQGSCIEIDGFSVLIQGKPGVGKSSLVLRLLSQGAGLISDDVTTLTCRDGRYWAVLPEKGKGMLEVRSVGILSGFRVGAESPLLLVIELTTEQPERLPEPMTEQIEGESLPLFRLWANHPALPEQVMAVYRLVRGELAQTATLIEKE